MQGQPTHLFPDIRPIPWPVCSAGADGTFSDLPDEDLLFHHSKREDAIQSSPPDWTTPPRGSLSTGYSSPPQPRIVPVNLTEKKLSELVQRIKERGHLKSIKAEFETEGTCSDELLRLLDVTRTCNVPLTLKIGGCEAVKDLYEARQVGARYIVAPMIESSYALKKFVDTIKRVYPSDELNEVDFLFNLETIQAYNMLESILEVALSNAVIAGVVFGRTDFSGSLGIKGDIQNEQVTTAVETIAQRIKNTRLDLVVGGAISIASMPELLRIARHKLTRFETRKVVFDATKLEDADLSDSLLDAVHFEILWLINKSKYYGTLHQEDEARIAQLEQRWNVRHRDITC